jgi:hypothetical protein
MWEYDTVPWGPDSTWNGLGALQGLSAMLAQKGEDQWELTVFFDQVPAGPRYFIFKRPKGG